MKTVNLEVILSFNPIFSTKTFLNSVISSTKKIRIQNCIYFSEIDFLTVDMKQILFFTAIFFYCLPQINKDKICDPASESFKFELLYRLVRQDNSAYCFFNARNSPDSTGTRTSTGTGSGTTTGLSAFTIGGSLTGITNAGLILSSGTTPDQTLTVSIGATIFQFANSIPSGTAYSISKSTVPAGLNCTVTNGTGIILANISNITIRCTQSLVGTPTFSPTPGHYGTAQNNITITTATVGASIYYTADGSTPTTASTLYNAGLGHIWSIAGRTLKAIAIKSGSTDSEVATAEYSYSPLKSGQALCYDATTSIGCPGIGGDGATQLGISRSYTNNGDSTVTDNATGLLWQRCTQGYSGVGCTGAVSSQSQSLAMAECATLTTANKTWRLPSRLELETLPDYAINGPSINLPTFPGTIFGDFWTSTGSANSVPDAWRVNFTAGDITTGTKVTNNRFRCVSGNNFLSFSKFTDNGDFTVKDNRTGLTWQKCSMGQTNDASCSGTTATSTWVASIAACSALNFANKTWRLPNIKELQSLVDTEIVSTAAINTTIFPSTFPLNYWSSTGYALTTTNGWSINFLTGSAAFTSKGAAYRVRCVSGP